MKIFSVFLRFLFAFFLLFSQVLKAQNFTPYTILISFDGYRWDYPNRGITPSFERIKKNGVSAISLQPSFPTKTFPNHYSIVTGLHPQNHGIISNNMYDRFYNEYFSLGDRNAVENSRWYRGEAIWETARKQGIKTASYFWPGSEIDVEYRRPDYFHYYDHNRPYMQRIDGVIEWLSLPYNERPKFITLYFDAADTDGHKYGPDSKEINNTISYLDSLLGILIVKLKEIKLIDSTNIILVSDHGMSEVSVKRIINIEDLLAGYNYKSVDDGAIMFIFTEEKDTDEIYHLLKDNENNFRTYYKTEIPKQFNISSSHLLPDIFLLADPGWSLITNRSLKWYSGERSGRGNHGYDNYHLDMHGVFYAIGPSFKKGYKTGTLRNVDIYPLLCEILNIQPRKNIDGKLERIQSILKNY